MSVTAEEFRKWLQVFRIAISPPATGDVVGPSSSLAGDIATFSGTTGKIIQDSGVNITSGIISNATWGGAIISMAKGGTGAALTPLVGALAYSTAGNLALLPAGATGTLLTIATDGNPA